MFPLRSPRCRKVERKANLYLYRSVGYQKKHCWRSLGFMSRHSGGHRTCCFIATKDVTKTQKKPKTKMELGNDDVQKESHLPGFFFHVTCLGYKYALEIYNRYPAMMVWKRWLRLFWVAMLGCFRRIPVENYSYMMWMVRYSCLHT